MKLLRQLLAVLLLVIMMIACEHESKKEHSTADLKIVENHLTENEKSPAPSPSAERQKYSPPRIVKDEQKNIDVMEMQGIADEGLVVEREEELQNFNTEDYDNIVENKFLTATQNPLSTFSIDVDEAAYSNIRRYLENGTMPPAGAVRIEEMINYFDYDYSKPQNEDPFTINTEIAVCPWNHHLKYPH